VYDRHNALVVKLMVRVPEEPYPNLNDSQTMKDLYFGMMAFGLFYWTLYASAVAGLTYVAMYPEIGKRLLGYVRSWA
jgi:hypothetical protein